MLAGLGGCALLLPGRFVFRGIGFDVHTLLYAFVSVLLGFQLIAFATFTKVFAITEGLLPDDPRLNRMFPLGDIGDRPYRWRLAYIPGPGWVHLCSLWLGSRKLRLSGHRAHTPHCDAGSLFPNDGRADHFQQLLSEHTGPQAPPMTSNQSVYWRRFFWGVGSLALTASLIVLLVKISRIDLRDTVQQLRSVTWLSFAKLLLLNGLLVYLSTEKWRSIDAAWRQPRRYRTVDDDILCAY